MPRREGFSTIKVEGTLLTVELLENIIQRSNSIEGMKPESYWLAPGERLNEQISRDWEQANRYWISLKKTLQGIQNSNPATSETRDRWLLPLFQLLQFGRLQGAHRLLSDNGNSYPISHNYLKTPIHLLGYNTDLNKRIEGRIGAAKMSAHSLVQDFLNNSKSHLWGIVTNGRLLRLLRDNANVARISFVEFDLETMMETGAYTDFTVFWLVLHASRFQNLGESESTDCCLERWSNSAQEQGMRMREDLSGGVQEAIKCLGSGFLSHPDNNKLRNDLKDGRLTPDGFRQQLFRFVYRLIFLFVAEDRGLLLMPEAASDSEARMLYETYYSTRILRKRARIARQNRYSDLYERLKTVMGLLKTGYAGLALPALGSFLWSENSIPDIMECKLENTVLLEALNHLCWTRAQDKSLLPVDWRNLGTEELGSIYESLLELVPDVNVDAKVFDLVSAAGNERKTTGSYYTRSDLINCLLESALDPVIERALSVKDSQAAEKALLALNICDPSCGSGHFLIAAAHRMAKKLASVQTGDVEPSPSAHRHALRQVISHCIYGVDINPMAVELCKVALWMDSMEPGKPLSFLDHHIKCGNSLVGAVPALMDKGIPDEAFKQLEGDSKEDCKILKSRNHNERAAKGQLTFLSVVDKWVSGDQWKALQQQSVILENASDDTLTDVERIESSWQKITNSKEMKHLQLQANAWCAAFVQEKRQLGHVITQSVFEDLMKTPEKTPSNISGPVNLLAQQYKFFHWHLEFPEVLQLPTKGKKPENELYGWNGGFDVILGNPPWDKVKMAEEEWFSKRSPIIAKARNASERKKLINALMSSNRYDEKELFRQFAADKRIIEGTSHFLHTSNRYPLSAVGDVNTYMVFTELNRNLIAKTGRAGFIIPSGIATDKSTAEFFSNLVKANQIQSLYGFENRKSLFPSVHAQFRFCLLTIAGITIRNSVTDYAYFLDIVDDLEDKHRHFSLTADEINLFNPNTRNCPTFRYRRDKEIAAGIYTRIPVLWRDAQPGQPEENPWSIQFKSLFHMSNDSYLFRTREQLEADGWILVNNRWHKDNQWMVPLYEGKTFFIFDARFGTYEGATQSQLNSGQLPQLTDEQHADPWKLPMPDNWVLESTSNTKLNSSEKAYICFRDITNATNQRTGIFAISPMTAYGNKAPLISLKNSSYIKDVDLLCSSLNSFVFDWVARFSVGGTSMNLYILKQLPVIAPEQIIDMEILASSIKSIAYELSYTSWDLYPWSKSIDHNHPPFRWDPTRRFELRCALDAACFHLYGINREDLEYIMDSFTGVKIDEVKEFGEFRSKRKIAVYYDDMAKAIADGREYKMTLEPAPASQEVMHPWPTRKEAEEKMPWIDWSDLPEALPFTTMLKKIRKELGFNPADMAQRLGLIKSDYDAIEIGTRNPSQLFLRKFETVFPQSWERLRGSVDIEEELAGYEAKIAALELKDSL